MVKVREILGACRWELARAVQSTTQLPVAGIEYQLGFWKLDDTIARVLLTPTNFPRSETQLILITLLHDKPLWTFFCAYIFILSIFLLQVQGPLSTTIPVNAVEA
jgi:hypothetical protein